MKRDDKKREAKRAKVHQDYYDYFEGENGFISKLPPIVRDGVFQRNGNNELPDLEKIEGYDFNQGVDYEKIIKTYSHSGCQATYVGKAIEITNDMINWRLSDEDIKDETDEQYMDPEVRADTRCTLFLGYSSSMISSGMRDIIRYLVQHKMVDAVVATAGGIEEDICKVFSDFYQGDFGVDGQTLRTNCINRVGNIFIPNANYDGFEYTFVKVIDEMQDEQDKDGTIFSPSDIINRLGKHVDSEESVYYWCYKNDIPVFAPAFTDGAIGDILYCQQFSRPGFVVDMNKDLYKINQMSVNAKKTGMLTLGAGVTKHHILNANSMRNGADYAVYINNAAEFDSSDSGALPSEAITWGKLAFDAKATKIHTDATLVVPLIIAETFAKNMEKASRLPEHRNKKALDLENKMMATTTVRRAYNATKIARFARRVCRLF
jgi:deoxyhypusine synthase